MDDAQAVAQVLGIPYYLLNFERAFQTHVIDYFVDEYARGRTPIPCLACNQYLKFDVLLQRALALGGMTLKAVLSGEIETTSRFDGWKLSLPSSRRSAVSAVSILRSGGIGLSARSG